METRYNKQKARGLVSSNNNNQENHDPKAKTQQKKSTVHDRIRQLEKKIQST